MTLPEIISRDGIHSAVKEELFDRAHPEYSQVMVSRNRIISVVLAEKIDDVTARISLLWSETYMPELMGVLLISGYRALKADGITQIMFKAASDKIVNLAERGLGINPIKETGDVRAFYLG